MPRDFDALIVHHTEDPDLVGEGVMNEGEFAVAARPDRHPEGRRDHHAGARHAPRRADRRALSRGLADLRGVARRCCGAPRTPASHVTASASINHLTLNENDIGPYRTFLKLSPPLRTEDDRQRAGRGGRLRPDRRDDVRPQSAGRRDQAPAVRRSRCRRHRARDHAAGGPAPRAQRRNRADDAAPGDVDAAGRVARPAGRHAAAGRAGRRDRDRSRRALGARSRTS